MREITDAIAGAGSRILRRVAEKGDAMRMHEDRGVTEVEARGLLETLAGLEGVSVEARRHAARLRFGLDRVAERAAEAALVGGVYAPARLAVATEILQDYVERARAFVAEVPSATASRARRVVVEAGEPAAERRAA